MIMTFLNNSELVDVKIKRRVVYKRRWITRFSFDVENSH